MPETSRRAVLVALGVTGLGTGLTYDVLNTSSSSEEDTKHVNTTRTETVTETATQTETKTATLTPNPSTWRLEPLGHSLLSSSSGGYAEGSVRADGRYAVIGTRFASNGSYLVDLRDPRSPRERHHLPAGEGVYSVDVKFDPRDGLYYRTLQQGETTGVEIVDYGFDSGTLRSPTIIGKLDAGSTHNLFVHPTASLVYTVNYSTDPDGGGIDVFDVAEPRSSRLLGKTGPPGVVHDVVYDPVRELLHCAYMGEPLDGYVILDASEPRNPTEIGRFEYTDEKSYEESDIGEEAFGNCHYADFDPRRGLAIVGDERSFGMPGGKHVFDIGWKDGSPANPIPVGFTHSPNAQLMSADSNDDGEVDQRERFDWTGHNFDVVPRTDATLLVSGDWHEGTVLYDITDPTNPHAIDVQTTDEKSVENPGEHLEVFGEAPMAWSAVYNRKRKFVLTSDLFSGIHTYRIEGITGTGTEVEATTTTGTETE